MEDEVLLTGVATGGLSEVRCADTYIARQTYHIRHMYGVHGVCSGSGLAFVCIVRRYLEICTSPLRVRVWWRDS